MLLPWDPMATIKKQGKGYKITVSHGYDISGKQLREHMTWTPPPGMTEKQLEKDLSWQATLFEEQVKHSTTHDSNTRLVDFTTVFLKEYARPTLKATTAFGYEQRMEIINHALGHVKLKDLKLGHIASFYANLQEADMRNRVLAAPKIDFAAWMAERKATMASLSRDTGVSIWCFKELKVGKPIAKKCGDTIAAALASPTMTCSQPPKT